METKNLDHSINDELILLAGQIRDWQQRCELTDTELCKRFAGLGSTKTFKRILGGDLAELDLERQLHNYRETANLIEIEAASGEFTEADYDDLSHVVRSRLAVTDAIQERGNNRLVIVEGASGSGKSTIKRCLKARFGRLVVMAEADETWRDSLTAMLRALILDVAGADRNMDGTGNRESDVSIPVSASEQKRVLFGMLCARKRVLIIDEAHHLGLRTLNLVKSLMNETPTVVVFLAIPTLLRRLESTAYEEARQLTRNRLCERVHVNGPSDGEVLTFLTRRGVTFTDKQVGEKCAKFLASRATQYGHWNFVNLVARKARREGAGGAVDEEQFASVVAHVERTRTGNLK